LTPQTSTTPKRRDRGGFALVGTIGGYFALCILVGLGAGFALDRVIHTTPLFLISGVVLGFIIGFYLVYKLAMGELGE